MPRHLKTLATTLAIISFYACGNELDTVDSGLNALNDSKTGRKARNTGTTVPNPSFAPAPGQENRSVYKLPVVTTDSGEQMIGFPGGTNPNGTPILKPEKLVTDIPNYPYETYQGNQENCAPRAFEVLTGIYNPYLEVSMLGTETDVNVGGKVYQNHGQNVRDWDVVIYRIYHNGKLIGKHAGIAVGTDADGKIIIATGVEFIPYQAIDREHVVGSYRAKLTSDDYLYPVR